MADDVGPEGASGPRVGLAPLWSRVLIFAAARLALLLVGGTLGITLGPDSDAPERPRPGADSVAVGFAQDMTRHHIQAVHMATWAKAHSGDPEIQQLAFDIAGTQLEQVGRMRGWLMLWNQPEHVTGEPMAWMDQMAGMDGMASEHSSGHSSTEVPMPGMATPDELAELRSLSGEELDVYFLQLMLRHHKGGVAMARYAKHHGEVDTVTTLANSMLVTQDAEMDVMKTMLAARDADPLSYP